MPAGLVVTPVADGERALTRARASRPDLFVVGSALPDMSGFSLCNRIRRAPDLGDVPVLLVPGLGDAAATEAHRAGRTPATDYLPAESDPEQIAGRIQELLGLSVKLADGADIEELSSDDLLSLDGPIQEDGGPPPLARAIADPFAGVGAEPRLAIGASPEQKLAFFRDRVKAQDELLARAREAFGAQRDALEAQARAAIAQGREVAELALGKREAEAAAHATAAELQALRDALAAAQGASQEATERAQSLSEMVSDSLREREQTDRDWSAKASEAAQRLQLLQEEADHLAGESERLGAELAARAADSEALGRALVEERQRSTELSGEAMAAKLEGAALQGELEALRQDAEGERARMAAALADLDSEREAGLAQTARALELEAIVESARNGAAELERDLEAARNGGQALAVELEAARTALAGLEAQLASQGEERRELEQRAADASGALAEARGELEALHETDRDSQGNAAALEGRLVAIEAEFASRDEECAGLRAEIGRVRADREQIQDEMAGQLAGLAQKLHEAEAAQRVPASAEAKGPKASTDKEAATLRVRLADLAAEVKALRARAPVAPDAALERLREELEGQKAENAFLEGELERLRGGAATPEELIEIAWPGK